MNEFANRELFWLIIFFSLNAAGFISVTLGLIKDKKNWIKNGILAFMMSGVVAVPYYYTGQEILEVLKTDGSAEKQLEIFRLDYYTTLTVNFFLGFSALFLYLIQKSDYETPKIMLVMLLIFSLLVTIYLSWIIIYR